MTLQRFLVALPLSVLAACSLSLDPSLDGKRCDSNGACVRGYVCSPQRICEHEGQVPIASDAAIDDARVAPDTSTAMNASAPDASSGGSGPVGTAPDSATTDAGPSDAATILDAAAPQVSQPSDPSPPTASADAGVVLTIPPAVAPPTPTMMMMPSAPDSSSPGAPPPSPAGPGSSPPAMMGAHPGTMLECPAMRTRCSDDCMDLQTDPKHCGGCGNTCDKQEVCKGGSCKKTNP